MNTKIIFLDFDGVITTPKSKWQIDQNKVNLITKICKETGAKIVVSSSWGVGKSIQDLRNITSFDQEFSNLIVGNIEHKYSLRGENIQEYIDNNNIKNYIIIDDASDVLEEQLLRFIQTDTYFGISEREVEICIDLLNNKYSPNPIRRNLILTTLWRNKCYGLNDGKLIDKILKNDK